MSKEHTLKTSRSKGGSPTSPLIEDYLLYNVGNEVPANYHRFSLLAISAALLECRTWVSWGYGTHKPNLFTLLIGPQGFRKSAAAEIAGRLLQSVDEHHPLASSVMSKESTIKRLAAPDASRVCEIAGRRVVYQPITFLLNEFKHTLSINPAVMVEFFTHLYDGVDTSSDTIKRGLEKVDRPVCNILACETTDWIVQKLRMDLISGGFSRRVLYIVEEDEPRRVAFPSSTPKGEAALERVRTKLRRLKKVKGEAKPTADAMAWYKDWYESLFLKNPTFSAFAKAYFRSRHVHMWKIAMIVAAADDNTLAITSKHLRIAHALLQGIEPRMFALGAMAGRNPLLAPAYLLLQELAKGAMSEHLVRRLLFEYANAREVEDLLRHLQATKQVTLHRNGSESALVELYGKKA